MAISKSQIDRLGERLRHGPLNESDLRLLDDYRRSFAEAYEAVVRTIRQLGQLPTGRLAKSTDSIVGKLRRESLRLSQMQDIAGCRLVVANVVEQEQLIASLSTAFPGRAIIDRRDYPSYGYRAVHIIVDISGKPVEIQLRTQLQHMWAEVSEKSSDVLDSTIKYGGGPAKWRDFLAQSSKSVMVHENFEKLHFYEVTATQLLMESREKAEKAAAEMIEHNAHEHELQEMQQQLEDLSRQIQLRRRLTEELQGDLLRSRKSNTDLLNWAISTLN